MVIDVPMTVIKDEQKMCDCCYLIIFSSFEYTLCQHFCQGQVLSLLLLSRSIPYKCCMEDLLITLAVRGAGVLPVCVNVFVCDGNESGTENWTLQNSL